VQSGRLVEAVVSDRGSSGRDLSARAAAALGIKECRTAEAIVSAQ
jgi:hypothetical protein